MWLVVGVLLGVYGVMGGIPPQCQSELDQYCNVPNHCYNAIKSRGCKEPFYARNDVDHPGSTQREWRCYTESTLSPDHTHYVNGTCFCTRQTQLTTLLSQCESNHTDSSVVVYRPGQNGVHGFRIPAVVLTLKGTLIAFAEARTGGDSVVKYIAARRSTDGTGRTWGPMIPVHTEGGKGNCSGNPMPVVDRGTGKILLQFITGCGNPALHNWQVESNDDGVTWGNLINLDHVLGTKYVGTLPGPGVAIQLQGTGAHDGRLVFGGHHGTYQMDLVWYSDDHGVSYKLSPSLFPKMDELAVVQLTNGSVMLNMRNAHLTSCKCRATSVSTDGGETWGPILYDDALISPICQASIVDIKGDLYFCNPASTTKRVDMTVRRSVSGGKKWESRYLVAAGDQSGGYSSLVPGALPGNITLGGVLYEHIHPVYGDVIAFSTFPLKF